jgi:hypothetical protein
MMIVFVSIAIAVGFIIQLNLFTIEKSLELFTTTSIIPSRLNPIPTPAKRTVGTASYVSIPIAAFVIVSHSPLGVSYLKLMTSSK